MNPIMDTAADLHAMGETERERAYARVRQWFADHTDKIIYHTYLMRRTRPRPCDWKPATR